MQKKQNHGINRVMLITGFAVLLAGTLVYLIDRPAQHTYFVKEILPGLNLHQPGEPVFGKLGAVLPAFVHPFSFSLITAALTAKTVRGCLIISTFWFAINSVFELGQYFKEFSSSLVPAWFQHIPWLENCETFFLGGTFDPLDLTAMFLGAFAAFVLTSLLIKKN